MKEEINIGGRQVWVLIEPHAVDRAEDDQPNEYFTASYAMEDPPGAPGGVLLLEDDMTPKRFGSPVEALEYTSEKLLGMV